MVTHVVNVVTLGDFNMGKEIYLTSKTFEMVNNIMEYYNLRHYNDAIEIMYISWKYTEELEI